MATEKRLKDADALKALFDEQYDDAFMQSHTRPNIAWWEGYSAGVNWGRNTIADAPTVDAVEVVHGEWIVCGDGEYVPFICSACGKTTSWYHAQTANYCPNCGAKMDGDGNG